jgi:hypothetical protein
MNMLDSRNIIKKFKYGELILWSICGTFNKYCMSFEPYCLTNSFRNFYIKAAAMTKADIVLCDIWAKKMELGLA